MSVSIDRIDHVVFTVRDIGATCEFYAQVLGMEAREFDGRMALHFGRQKINLHRAGHDLAPPDDATHLVGEVVHVAMPAGLEGELFLVDHIF